MQDRQITIARLIAAPVAAVWRCWSDPVLLPQWFGPEGYRCITKEIDLRDGGVWRFDMIGPDGTVWANRHRYTKMQVLQQIEFLLDDDTDDESPLQVVVTLTPAPSGVQIIQTMTFPTAQARDGALAFGADKLGQTTLVKLESAARGLQS